MEQTTINKETLQQVVHQLLRSWRKPGPAVIEMITHLRCYQQLAGQDIPVSAQPAAIVQRLVEQALAVLARRDPQAADLLRRRYLGEIGAKVLAQNLSISESQYYLLQNEALIALAEVLFGQEQQAQFEYRLAVEARLEPLAHQQLFGVEALRQQLEQVVIALASPWLISIEGLGGIGKTSLADHLARGLIASSRFFEIAWVHARQESFHPALGIRPTTAPPTLTPETLADLLLAQLGRPQALNLETSEKAALLNRLLKQHSYLIVIDNLETAGDYQVLIPSLRQWANPTKFVLTSRLSLRAYSDIFCLSLTELSQADTLTFLKHAAEERRLAALAEALPEQLADIYRVVGGNPLALKLILGQIHVLPLAHVLESLKQAQGRKITELYSYIYRQSWQALSQVGRQVLLALPLASPRGSTIEHLLGISGLTRVDLAQGLEELVAFSLVEVGGDMSRRRYSIHRLTETFLLTEVAQWQ
jgi:hypothetical protein